MSTQQAKPEPTPLEIARKNWNEHAARCFRCKAAKENVCDDGAPLLKAVLELMGGESLMLLGFRRRFEAYVLDGSKSHTIRGRRKIRPRVGDIAHCYVDPRQKTMRLLGRWPVTRVEEIRIEESAHPARLLVTIDGVTLDPHEAELLFHRDGFRDRGGETYQSMAQARMFWAENLPFVGDLIHWDFSRPVAKETR